MILLSFDIEEFDLPQEYGFKLSIEEQIQISVQGTLSMLSLLKRHQIKATFFCTAFFALQAPDIIRKIASEGHEVASHGYHHSSFSPQDLISSKKVLEDISQKHVSGFRMARMMPVDEKNVFDAGYTYNSSLNPTFIPGRYNNLDKPRTYFMKEGVFQLPASVTPIARFPLFWLAYHNLPQKIFLMLALRTLKKDKYLNIYFHPWEFVDLKQINGIKLPYIITKNSGVKMLNRLEQFIIYFKLKAYLFSPINQFISSIPFSLGNR